MAKQRFTSAFTDEQCKICLEDFRTFLQLHNRSENTIRSYLFVVRQFYELFHTLSPDNLLLYKCYLIDHYKPQTVNLRIRSMNCFTAFLKLPYAKLLMVKHHNPPFLENVISLADYEYLKNCLLRDGKTNYYFVIRLMAGTGLRVSELVQLKIEHIWIGYIDLYSKGNRMRRVYIPKNIRQPCLKWIHDSRRTSGDLFLNRYGNRISVNGIRKQLSHLALLYDLDPSVLHPHTFRHLFAKKFIEQCSDIFLIGLSIGDIQKRSVYHMNTFRLTPPELIEEFTIYLRRKDLAPNTISAYVYSIQLYFKHCGQLSPTHFQSFREFLIHKYRPSSSNQRIHALNHFLLFLDQCHHGDFPELEHYRLITIKLPKRSFHDSVISNADCKKLQRKLKNDGHIFWYFIVRFLVTTGVRVGELTQIKVEHLACEYLDLHSKGGKILTRSAIGLPKISFFGAEILPCWPICWAMRASKPHASISHAPARNNSVFWTIWSPGDALG